MLSVLTKVTLSKSVFRSNLLAVTLISISATYAAAQSDDLDLFEDEIVPVLDQYCYDCHGYGDKKGDVVLDEFTSTKELKNPHLWQRALHNIRTGLMPPSDEDQPDEEEKEILLNWIKDKVFELDTENPDPGQITVRRLNREDYKNTIKDLFGVTYNTSSEFPADDTGDGFDNIGSVLTISPMLLEKYLDAAQLIVSEAVPTHPFSVEEHPIQAIDLVTTLTNPTPLEEGEEEKADPGNNEPRFDDKGKPLKKLSYYDAAITTATQTIEKDGEYQVVLQFGAHETYVNNVFDLNECKLVFKIDGETALEQDFTREGQKLFTFTYDKSWKAGDHNFSFEITPLTPDVDQIRDLRFEVTNVIVRGPLRKEEWVPTKNYDKYFPSPTPTTVEEQPAYIREVLKDFASKAFRRPVDELTLDRLCLLAESTAMLEGNSYEKGIAQSMTAMLASSRFLFRQEEVLDIEASKIHPLIDEYSLASRLSYFLWSTMPDQELFDLAAEGQLRSNLHQQFERMLEDPRSAQFVSNFTGQWLQARDIEKVTISDFSIWLRDKPNEALSNARKTFERTSLIPRAERSEEDQEARKAARQIFRSFFGDTSVFRARLDGGVRKAMKLETEMVFNYVLQEDRNISELIDSDYTFLNAALAKHYSIEGVEGDEMRKFTLPENSARGGILTQGTILAVTSNPTRTSPVKRGVFLLDNILGMPPPPPPPNIPALEDVASAEELKNMSLRETLALHAKREECRNCHNRMDPLGLALENFNAMGVWRDEELNMPIEPEGVLITGEEFSDIRELKATIVSDHMESFHYCLSEKLLTYALGRSLEYYDTDTIDTLVRELEENNGSPKALLFAIISSDAFQRQRNQESVVSLHP